MTINWTNVTNPEYLLTVPNENTGGAFWISIPFMIWVILLISFARFGFEIAFLGASFISLIATLFLVFMNLVAWTWTLFFLGCIVFMFLYIVWSSNKDTISG